MIERFFFFYSGTAAAHQLFNLDFFFWFWVSLSKWKFLFQKNIFLTPSEQHSITKWILRLFVRISEPSFCQLACDSWQLAVGKKKMALPISNNNNNNTYAPLRLTKDPRGISSFKCFGTNQSNYIDMELAHEFLEKCFYGKDVDAELMQARDLIENPLTAKRLSGVTTTTSGQSTNKIPSSVDCDGYKILITAENFKACCDDIFVSTCCWTWLLTSSLQYPYYMLRFFLKFSMFLNRLSNLPLEVVMLLRILFEQGNIWTCVT